MARESRETRLPETDDTGEESSELKGNMGNKAWSHDSVFLSEPALENEASNRLSQENIAGNVKALQLQLKQNIRVGSPPQLIMSGKSEDVGTVSEDDGLPRSPPEISTLQEILTSTSSKSSNPVQRHSSLSLGGTDTEDDQVSSEASSRPVSPLSSLVLVCSASMAISESPVDFSVPANPLVCLDSSAARHRIAINPRKQRGPGSRSKLRPEEESKANVLNIPVSLEGEIDAIKLISIEQNEEVCGGGSMVQAEKNNDKEVHIATESTDFTKNSDAFSSCQNLVSTDRALTHEEACPEDSAARNNDLLSSSYVESILTEEQKASRNEENEKVEPQVKLKESGSENNPHPQPTHGNIIELVKPVEADSEIQHRDGDQEMAPKRLNTIFKEKEDTCAEDTPTSLPESVMCTEDEPCHSVMATKVRDEFLSCDNEKTLITFGLYSSDNLQAQPSTLETATETTPTITEDRVIQPRISEAHEEPKVILQTDSDMRDLDLNRLLVESKIPEELHLVRELQSPLSEGSSEDTYVISGADSSEEEPKISASIPILNVECSNVVAASNDEEQLDLLSTRAKSSKTNKIVEENTRGVHEKCTGKPVRFTIATAWQRSLSGGLSFKEETFARNLLASAIKPEWFEGTGSEDAEKEKTRPKSALGNQENVIDRANIDAPPEKKADVEAQDPETPFGIRLKRTSSLIRYSGESGSEFQKMGSSAVCPSPSLQATEIQKSPAAVKLPNVLPAGAKPVNKESSLQEENPPQKIKAEDLPKMLPTSKTAEKVLNSSGAASKPAWISVAKLKQKGFHGHLRVKEQIADNRAVAEMDIEKRLSYTVENALRKNLGSDLPGMEKSQAELPVMSIAAASGGLECPALNLVPVTEKDDGLSSSPPLTPNSSAEPPWMSLAKKKHKAWSEMPQIVQ